MNWLKIIIDIALVIIPGLGLKHKKDLERELEIANKTIEFMSNHMDPVEKGKFIEQAVGSLKAVKDFKKRANKKLDKARERLYKKLF